MWSGIKPYNLYTFQSLQRGLQLRPCITWGSRARCCNPSTACHAPHGLTSASVQWSCLDRMSVLCAMHAWAAKVHPPSSMTTNQPPFTMGAARVATGPSGESRPFRSRSIHRPSSLATARLAELEAEDHGGRNQRQRQPAATQVISHMISHNWLYHNYVISHNCEITCVLHDITYDIMCDIDLPVSWVMWCSEKGMMSCVISWKIDDITWPKKRVNQYHIWYHIWYHSMIS